MRGSLVRHVTARFAVVLATVLVGVSTPQALAIVGPTPGSQIYFAASIQTSGGQHLCGGTLIAAQWVLTVKQCLVGGTAAQARTGTMNRTSGGSLAAVALIARHPWADLALIRLNAASVGRPVAIATASPAVGTPTTIMGWGGTCQPGGQTCGLQTQLQTLRTSIVSDTACGGYDGGGTLCTDNPNDSGACTGDEGGPQVTGNSSTSWELVGTASAVSSLLCGAAPSIYVDVPVFRSWIAQVTGIQ